MSFALCQPKHLLKKPRRHFGAVLRVHQEHNQGCPIQQVVSFSSNRHHPRNHRALVLPLEPDGVPPPVPFPFTILERLVQDGLEQGIAAAIRGTQTPLVGCKRLAEVVLSTVVQADDALVTVEQDGPAVQGGEDAEQDRDQG
jgi:hypothetical protein